MLKAQLEEEKEKVKKATQEVEKMKAEAVSRIPKMQDTDDEITERTGRDSWGDSDVEDLFDLPGKEGVKQSRGGGQGEGTD